MSTSCNGQTKPLERALRDVQPVDGSPVPGAWTAALAHLHEARVARDGTRNPDATAQMRDEATVRYGRALDGLFAAMDDLMTKGVTGVITSHLCKREKR